SPASETIDLCRTILSAFKELPVERVREEWLKWASASEAPAAGLRFLEATRWIEHFPELARIRGVPQDPDWHPEGDVFTHTCHCLEALVRLPDWLGADNPLRRRWSLAVLTHDFGKAVCTEVVERDGRPRITSPGHERESERLASEFLARIGIPRAITERVLRLV